MKRKNKDKLLKYFYKECKAAWSYNYHYNNWGKKKLKKFQKLLNEYTK